MYEGKQEGFEQTVIFVLISFPLSYLGAYFIAIISKSELFPFSFLQFRCVCVCVCVCVFFQFPGSIFWPLMARIYLSQQWLKHVNLFTVSPRTQEVSHKQCNKNYSPYKIQNVHSQRQSKKAKTRNMREPVINSCSKI